LPTQQETHRGLFHQIVPPGIHHRHS
jgi:hypothetical protein